MALGNSLQRRFKRLGHLEDINDAISIQQRAAKLAPDGRPDNPLQLNSIGSLLATRSERLGNIEDINAAISTQRRAVDLIPNGHPDRPLVLSNLGCSLNIRFGLLGRMTDIDNAISHQQKAVELTLEGHPDKPRQLSNLGNSFGIRFERLRNLPDIDNAISSQRKAVELTPKGNPDKYRQLSNLGGSLQRRFTRLGRLEDIDEAISTQQEALGLTKDDHADLLPQISSLGSLFQSRFKGSGDHTDIEKAISNLQKAADLTPNGHPDKPGRLNNLAIAFISRFESLNISEDLQSALKAYSRAACSPTGPAIVRFKAARAWAQHSEKNSLSPLFAYRCATNLLPRVGWLGLPVTDQLALLADVGDVVRDAVAAAIRWEEYETAVEWAEQGRSIVWQNLLGLRSHVEDLRATDPDLADRIQKISRQMEAFESHGTTSEKTDMVPGDVARDYSELATEWEKTVEKIRSKPEFEDFLRPKRFSTLAPAANEGPVVILNVQHSRCDALLLLSENKHTRAINIPLEGFTYETSKTLFYDLTGLLSSAGVRTRKQGRAESETDGSLIFEEILRTLWLQVVKPVIKRLTYQVRCLNRKLMVTNGFDQARFNNRPRIWWCPTGFLSFLPLHAAGLYGIGETKENISDYIISSYTPTLTAILDLPEPTVGEDFQVLTVAQPSTPYATPIPKTHDEVELVHSMANGVRVMSLSSAEATVERVVEGMKQSHWIHLACHGEQNVKNPMESGFLLHDKILKLSEIVKFTLPKADFAFLSACQTATGNKKVAEESVHLAAGMLLSGCRGVIATMWSIRDEDGPQIAGDVYCRILKDARPNRKEAAYALHEAAKRLRDSGAGFVSWVPFIHIGR